MKLLEIKDYTVCHSSQKIVLSFVLKDLNHVRSYISANNEYEMKGH